MSAWITPPELARQRGIRPAKVLAWIRRGELEAINLASSLDGRPRWRISPEALARFDAARSSRGSARPSGRRRIATAAEVEHFF